MAPKVAVRLSRLSTTALSGTSRLPNSRNSTTKVTSGDDRQPASGSRAKSDALESTSCADGPPTSTANGAGHGAHGVDEPPRPRRTSGSTDGHDRQPRPASGPANRADAGAGRGDLAAAGVGAGERRRPGPTPGTCDSGCGVGGDGGRCGRRVAGARQTTSRALDSSRREVVAERRPAPARAGSPGGSTRSSGRPKAMCRNGVPSTSSRTMAAVAIGSGRRITVVAIRCQKPWPTARGRPAGGTPASVFTRWPEHGEQRRQHDDRADGGEDDHGDAGVGERLQEVRSGTPAGRPARRPPSRR